MRGANRSPVTSLAGLYNGGMNRNLLETHAKEIKGTISCFDRLIFYGTFREICNPIAMGYQLYLDGSLYKDYENKYANELRLNVKKNIQSIAKQKKLDIHHLNHEVRKEAFVQNIIKTRRVRSGVVCILSAMESCSCFKTKKNNKTNYLELQWSKGKCLHYYIYILDKEYGLCHLRIPTWAPFRLQFYFNGHDWLERQMKSEGIRLKKIDNCFVHISNFERAQEISNSLVVSKLHERLNELAGDFVSVFSKWGGSLQWSIHQAEMATDIIFKNDSFLPVLYDELIRTAAIEIKVENIYSFLGKRLTKASTQEVASRLQTFIEGTRIKHSLGKASVKMYDKQGVILRIETTTNNVSMFKHHREVKRRDGTSEKKYAAMKKTIYSLGALHEQMLACNKRYLNFISQWKDHTRERSDLDRVTKSVKDEKERSYRGLNFFHSYDLRFIQAILRGENEIYGVSNRMLQKNLPGWSSNKIGRVLKRFRVLKLIKRVGRTYKYYLTELGKRTLVAALQLKERVIIPAFSHV